MNVLLLGSGGREHALAWKLCQSPILKKLFIAPGNAGTTQCGQNIPVSVNDFDAIKRFVLENAVQMVVVGPEDPLVNGIADYFLSDPLLQTIPVIGPGKKGAMLEGSKDFSKAFMQRHQIPTARYQTFDKATLEDGYRFLETLSAPYVLKADGLAAGKGVLICQNIEEAKQQLNHILNDQPFGNASNKVVIEEFLHGIELSVFILTDGTHYIILPEAKDYKRIGNNDTGLNTGGMGAVSPVAFADSNFMQKVEERIIQPTLKGLQSENVFYKGFLFIGLMNVDGNPFVIEYNCRLGDPETEAILPRMETDLLQLFMSLSDGTLKSVPYRVDERTSLVVILVSGGYPENYEKGKVISGLDKIKDVKVFHAGTASKDNIAITNGGRVLAVQTSASTIEEARKKVYSELPHLQFDKVYFRNDIGIDLMKYQK
ncbi:MAG: phosphoribosylamine--glycine ligase [Bacteroidia bacterium]|nr:phosphoribosylamine--glycine ligase [Bacteroidia bacterium]